MAIRWRLKHRSGTSSVSWTDTTYASLPALGDPTISTLSTLRVSPISLLTSPGQALACIPKNYTRWGGSFTRPTSKYPQLYTLSPSPKGEAISQSMPLDKDSDTR